MYQWENIDKVDWNAGSYIERVIRLDGVIDLTYDEGYDEGYNEGYDEGYYE